MPERTKLGISHAFLSKNRRKTRYKIDFKIPVLRRFASIEEQILWFEAADKPTIKYFYPLKFLKIKINIIQADFGMVKFCIQAGVDYQIVTEAL